MTYSRKENHQKDIKVLFVRNCFQDITFKFLLNMFMAKCFLSFPFVIMPVLLACQPPGQKPALLLFFFCCNLQEAHNLYSTVFEDCR
jgi:hypothetical protein